MIIVGRTLTNNVNRTATLRFVLHLVENGRRKHGCSRLYFRICLMRQRCVGIEGKSSDDVLEILMEADVDARDIIEEDDAVIVYAEPDQFHVVQEALKQAGIEEFTVAELSMLAQNDITLDAEAQEQFEKLIDALEDLEDVQQVYHNVDLG